MEEKVVSMEGIKALAEMFFDGTDKDVEELAKSFIDNGYTIVD